MDQTKTPSYFSNHYQEVIDQIIQSDPQRFERAQKEGEKIMNRDYDRIQMCVDTEGEKLIAKRLKNDITNYGLEIGDLSEYEKKILEKEYGTDWIKLFD